MPIVHGSCIVCVYIHIAWTSRSYKITYQFSCKLIYSSKKPWFLRYVVSSIYKRKEYVCNLSRRYVMRKDRSTRGYK